MAKAKRVTVRLDDELDAIINQACVDGSCDKTAVVLSALKKGLSVSDVEVQKATMPVKSEPYDVWDSKTGCCGRFRANGEQMFHFEPTEIENGVRYYRDTLNKDFKGKWSYHKVRGWIPRVSLY
jgi:hypothetical protein